MTKNSAVLRRIVSFLFILIILCSCSTRNASPGGGGSPGDQADAPAEPTATIPPPTPTVKRTIGSGELHVDRFLNSTTSNGGNISHSVVGIVPFKIQFSQKKGVYQVKGNHQGSGKTEFNSPNCQCSATWVADLTVSGTLIPIEGLIAEGGCFLQIHVSELWEMHDAVCNCDIGSAMVTTSPNEVDFGPLKLDLLNGAQTGELETVGNTSWNYIWRVDKLNIPLESGCMAGETIDTGE